MTGYQIAQKQIKKIRAEGCSTFHRVDTEEKFNAAGCENYWGSNYEALTKSDIEYLLSGGVLWFTDGEYETYICLADESKVGDKNG